MQIGEQLKEAREQKNLTLDDIQVTTKIQKRYLVAIEQNDYSALPGRFYARAFIKEYAHAVGLDSNLLLSSFDEDKIEVEEEDVVQYSRLKRNRPTDTGKGSSILSFLPSVIVVLLIVSILVVAWTLYQKSLSKPVDDRFEEHDSDEIMQRNNDESKQTAHDEDEEDKKTDDEPEAEEEEEETSGSFTDITPGTGSSPESSVTYTSTDDHVTITLTGTADSYVQVRSEGGTSHFDGMFTSGMTEEFEIPTNERLYFNVGHAPGLTISVNNVELEYPVSTADYVHQKIWLDFN